MYFKTAYDTTLGKTFSVAKVIKAIQESAIRDGAYHKDFGLVKETKTIPWFVVGSTDTEAQIPFFTHPILVDLMDRNEKAYCVDIRPFASYNKNHVNNDDALRIKNRIELNLAKLRLMLSIHWIEERPTALRELSHIPMAIFANWISESVTRRFGLNPKDQIIISIICCYYYFSLFSERIELSEDEMMRLTSVAMKITRAPSSMVEEVLQKVTPVESIGDLAKNIKNISDNTRLENFEEGLLINLLITSWFGTEARQLIAVSLEHPPTWISIVYSAFTEKSYKNTIISKIAQRYLGPKGETDFVRSLATLVNQD